MNIVKLFFTFYYFVSINTTKLQRLNEVEFSIDIQYIFNVDIV
jgi:hypothetical protein